MAVPWPVPRAATVPAPTPLTMPAIGSFLLTRLKPSALAAGTTERSPPFRCATTLSVNLAEADDAAREKPRLALGKTYRTFLGH